MKDHSWQVSNLELSKRLKELGVKQESVWWWHGREMAGEMYYEVITCDVQAQCRKMCGYIASAFTVAELGEMLPNSVEDYQLIVKKEPTQWFIGYGRKGYVITENKSTWGWKCGQDADTEANARAKMLIYLKEKKLL